MKKLLLIAALLFAGYAYLNSHPALVTGGAEVSAAVTDSSAEDAIISEAFANHSNNLQVSGRGTVAKILPDDTDGSRHQRFILELASGHTLLVAHNIDLAPRIDNLQVGDRIEFNGEYEWNYKGGVIHWTHHDPDGSHTAGWLKHGGQTYQ